MKRNYFITFLGSILLPTIVSAVSPCELSSLSGSIGQRLASKYSSKQILEFKNNLQAECIMQADFKSLSDRSKILNVDLDMMNTYKALSYVKREWYEWGKSNNVQVPYIYQKYRDPITRTREIWDNAMLGMSQVEEVSRTLRSRDLSLDDLQEWHRGFYQLSDEVGDFNHEPNPGSFKASPGYSDRAINEAINVYWWRWGDLDSEIVRSELENIEKVNGYFYQYNLIGTTSDDRLNFFLKGDQTGVIINPYFLESKTIFLVRFINTYKKIINDKYENLRFYNYPLLTPLQFASLVQKWLVIIHPWSEGNGRMTRLIQDGLANLYGLPAQTSGELMDIDVTTPVQDYYEKMYSYTMENLEKMGNCLSGYERNSLRVIQSYDCKIIE
ncbi:MAG: hypothetical protein CME65_04260 [Halobacteriovoraceae bacterium]|nr:hypothetical protein [Halobacteriovoraceae bacterium]|tara:strand:- start:1523 stop:2677 length:1155 start_codon:yes stop_codon:yes gene_type:complete